MPRLEINRIQILAVLQRRAMDELPPNKSLQLTFDSPLGLATPSPPVESNAAELRC